MRLLTILTFLLTTTICSGQLLNEPTKKSEVIIVVLHETTAADAYRRCANVLQDAGWVLENTDAMLYTITTDWVNMGGFFVRDWQINANAREVDGDAHVYLRAKVRQDVKATNRSLGVTSAEDYHFYNISKKVNLGKDWQKLMEVAEDIGGQDMMYK